MGWSGDQASLYLVLLLDLFCGASGLQEFYKRLSPNESALIKTLIASLLPKEVTWQSPVSVWEGTTQIPEFQEACPLGATDGTVSSSSGCVPVDLGIRMLLLLLTYHGVTFNWRVVMLHIVVWQGVTG